MSTEPLRHLLRGLHRLTEPVGGGLTDAQLLERYLTARDQAAFEVLFWRHGPMVLGVCRRLLRHEQDAEDVFQATFLVLVRKAASIGKREAVGSWLYKVAYRAALAARARSAERTLRERPGAEAAAAPASESPNWSDLQPVLDAELMRLPEPYRAAFVLCYLEGKTLEEAGRQLGCARGTIASRLARARERLRRGLARRQVTVTAVGLAAATAENALAAVPPGLAGGTLQAVLSGTSAPATAAMVSARVLALTEGVLRTMYLIKVKNVLTVLLAIVLIGSVAGIAGSGLLDGVAANPPEQPEPAAVAQKGKKAAQPKVDAPEPDPLRQRDSQRKLKMIGLALHNHHDTYKYLPPPAIYSKDGEPLLSWRVAILPWLEQDNLYRQFKLDEPWDSEHNQKLLAQMPDVYAPPGKPAKMVGGTYYQAFVGKDTAFEPKRKLKFAQFTDGLSNTLAVVEAAKPVPWTKPEDVPYAAGKPLPKLGGLFGGHFNGLVMDGSVQLFSKNADPETLRKLITRNGGEIVDFERLRVPQIGVPGKEDLEQLPQENRRLKAALDAATKEVEQQRKDLETLRRQLGRDAADVPKLVREHRELRKALDEVLDELERLRAQRAALERALKKQ
jgi:RNA polymerase sigma factor (sigma-70 family)